MKRTALKGSGYILDGITCEGFGVLCGKEFVSSVAKATNVSDVATVIISTKALRMISRILEEEHDTKVKPDVIREIIEEKLFSGKNIEINKGLLKRLNKPIQLAKRTSIAVDSKLETEIAEDPSAPEQTSSDESEHDNVA